MNQMQVSYELLASRLNGSPLDTEQLHQDGERLMSALLDLEGCNSDIADPAVSSDATLGLLTVEMLVTADNELDAAHKAATVLRTAVHAIGGATPDWPGGDELQSVTVQSAQFRTSVLRLEALAR